MLLVMHMVYETTAMAAGGFLMAAMASCSGWPRVRKLNAEWLKRSTLPLFCRRAVNAGFPPFVRTAGVGKLHRFRFFLWKLAAQTVEY
jgi:hypothetical protein